MTQETNRCPHCGQEVAGAPVTCPHCGKALEAVCPDCGKPNPPGSRFCNHCGHKMDGSTPPPPEPTDREFDSLISSYMPRGMVDKLRRQESLPGERRNVAILFADIVGFTVLSESLDPEEITQILSECLRVMAEAVFAHEGMVDKFIGDEIMAVFGAPIALENACERAARAALKMREDMKTLSRRLGRDLNLSIGINYGLVSMGIIGHKDRREFAVLGDTVNLTKGLELVAGDGEIVVGEPVFALTGGVFEFSPMPTMIIKQRKTPVQPYKLLGLRKVPQARRGLTGFKVPLISRDKELKLLLQCAREACTNGKGGAVAVVGPAGIGKTRLVSEFSERYRDEFTAELFRADSLSYSANPEYSLIRQLVLNLIGTETEVREERRTTIVSKLIDWGLSIADAELISRDLEFLWTEETPSEPVDAATARSRKTNIRSAIRRMIELRATRSPIILLLDDLHWADEASLAVVDSILSLVGQVPAFVVIMHRDEFTPNLRQANIVKQIKLLPLSHADCLEILRLCISWRSQEQILIDRLAERSEGIPYNLEELIKSLRTQGILVPGPEARMIFSPEAWSEKVLESVPETLAEIAANRIDRLPDAVRDVLCTASAIDRVFTSELLLEVATNPSEVLPALALLLEEGLIEELPGGRPDDYAFTNHVAQQVAYNRLLLKHRKVLHRRIAESYEKRYPKRSEQNPLFLARHWRLAEENRAAARYFLQAGLRARALFQNALSLECFHAVADLVAASPEPTTEGRCRALSLSLNEYHQSLQGLGETLMHIGEWDKALATFRTIREETLSGTASVPYAVALIKSAEIYRASGKLTEAERDLAEAVSDLEGREEREFRQQLIEAHNLMANILTARNDLPQALEYLEKSLELARKVGYRRGESHALNLMGVHYRMVGHLTRSLEALEQAKRIREESHDRFDLSTTLSNIGLTLVRFSRYLEAIRHFETALAIQREIGFTKGVAEIENNLGLVYFNLGKLQQALELFEDSLQIKRELGDLPGIARTLNNLALTYLDLGDREKFLDISHQSLEIRNQLGDKAGMASSLNNLGAYHFDQGDLERALEYRHKALAYRKELGLQGKVADSLALIAEILIHRGFYREAAEHLDEAMAINRELGNETALAKCNVIRAELFMIQGSLAKALEAIDATFRSVGDKLPTDMAQQLYHKSLILAFDGQLPEAKAEADRCIQIAEAAGNDIPHVALDFFKGIAALMERDISTARSHFRLVLEDDAREQEANVVGNACHILAWLALHEKDWDELDVVCTRLEQITYRWGRPFHFWVSEGFRRMKSGRTFEKSFAPSEDGYRNALPGLYKSLLDRLLSKE